MYILKEFASSHLLKTAKECLYEVQKCDIIPLMFVKRFFVTCYMHIRTINTSTNVCT